MEFHIKRLFANPFKDTSNQTIYLSSSSDYVISKFLTILSNKLYTSKINSIYLYDNFKTNYINSVLLPDFNISIKSSRYMNHKYNLDDIIKDFRGFKDINDDKDEIEDLKNRFNYLKKEIYGEFNIISSEGIKYIDDNLFCKFKDDFISSFFNKDHKDTPLSENKEFSISSTGIENFKTFSSNLQMGENKVFIINDPFSSFKDMLFSHIIKKLKEVNINYECYKSPIDKDVIDHIKIPSFNLCIISNNLLFNEKIPGVQINSRDFMSFKYKSKDSLNKIILEFKPLCASLKNKYEYKNKLIDSFISTKVFNSLCDDIIKNVIH